MEITQKLIEVAVKAKLLGKNVKFAYADFGCTVISLLKEFINESNLDVDVDDFDYRQYANKQNTILLTYKKLGFGTASFTKTQDTDTGNWIFKKIWVRFWNASTDKTTLYSGLSFSEMLQSIEKLKIEQEAQEKEIQRIADTIFAKIKKEYGENCRFKAEQFVDFLQKKRNSLKN